jgi:hypothetical protein
MLPAYYFWAPYLCPIAIRKLPHVYYIVLRKVMKREIEVVGA